MGYRNIKIETSQQLNIKNSQLLIGSSGEVQIPLEDINSILIESQAVTLSSYFLQKMAEMGIAVYVCDEKHLPNAVLLPMVRHSRHFKLLKCQMNLGKPKQKRLWQQIVVRKIENQSACLKFLNLEGAEELLKMSKQVQSGDKTNVEAKAAAFYFRRLYGLGFSRGDDHIINSALNYGYAILRAIVARALVTSGLLPTLGIHHHNRYNAYCLADDVMEPYRPYVDELVYSIVKGHENYDELTKDLKTILLNIPTLEVMINGKRSPLMVAVAQTTASLYKCFTGELRRIIYPEK